MAIAANSSSMPLAELRRMMEAAAGAGSHRPVLPFGIKEIDEALPGGGLALGAVHEFSEEGPRGGYAACALLFAAGILARLPGPVLWCLHSRDLFAPALARVGLHPDRIIFCETWKDAEILPAMEEGLRMRGLAGVVGELNRISLTPVAAAAACRRNLRRSRPHYQAILRAFEREQCRDDALAHFARAVGGNEPIPHGPSALAC